MSTKFAAGYSPCALLDINIISTSVSIYVLACHLRLIWCLGFVRFSLFFVTLDLLTMPLCVVWCVCMDGFGATLLHIM
jgi:hypothetical protein